MCGARRRNGSVKKERGCEVEGAGVPTYFLSLSLDFGLLPAIQPSTDVPPVLDTRFGAFPGATSMTSAAGRRGRDQPPPPPPPPGGGGGTMGLPPRPPPAGNPAGRGMPGNMAPGGKCGRLGSWPPPSLWGWPGRGPPWPGIIPGGIPGRGILSMGHMCIVMDQSGCTTFSQTVGRMISPSGAIKS